MLNCSITELEKRIGIRPLWKKGQNRVAKEKGLSPLLLAPAKEAASKGAASTREATQTNEAAAMEGPRDQLAQREVV